MTASDGALGDGSSNESTSNSGKPPSFTHSTAWIPSILLRYYACRSSFWEFTNWAFGPHGLPTLEVLAFGDFSHDGRFHVHNKNFFRHTWSTRYPGIDTSQQIDELIITFRPGSDYPFLHIFHCHVRRPQWRNTYRCLVRHLPHLNVLGSSPSMRPLKSTSQCLQFP
jgi:hypothetical protein